MDHVLAGTARRNTEEKAVIGPVGNGCAALGRTSQQNASGVGQIRTDGEHHLGEPPDAGAGRRAASKAGERVEVMDDLWGARVVADDRVSVDEEVGDVAAPEPGVGVV